ncbi:MAG: hypothetical protein ACWA47_11490 [Brevirhabdus sp.]
MEIVMMGVLWLLGAIVMFALHAKGKSGLARILFGIAVIGTGVALIAAGIIGGRFQRDFQDILMLRLTPALLGMAIGFYVGKIRAK